MLRPESVVVPKPVDETERKEVLVELAALVDEAMEKSTEFVFPYGLNTERLAVGVLVPIARFPAK